ncbi:MAG: hypothetical protein GXP25_04535 [Planctomycetes bacterium]|nr:hypothetical protein [Planctomycetota bacterium]
MKVDQSRHENVVGIAWYKPTQWKRLLQISEDSVDLEGKYLDWSDAASDAMRQLTRAGLRVLRVDIDIEQLSAWCEQRGLPVSAESRSRYLGERLREEYL